MRDTSYLKKPKITKLSAKAKAKVQAARQRYDRVMKIAAESPTKMTRTGIKYTDLAAMLKVRGKPLTVAQIERRVKSDATKILRGYSQDLTKMWKTRGETTRKQILEAVGGRQGNADFLKQLKSFSGGELYALSIQKNYDINKFLFSNSPNSVILQDDTTEALDDTETLILDILRSLGVQRGIKVYK